jgi:hypothetical protein
MRTRRRRKRDEIENKSDKKTLLEIPHFAIRSVDANKNYKLLQINKCHSFDDASRIRNTAVPYLKDKRSKTDGNPESFAATNTNALGQFDWSRFVFSPFFPDCFDWPKVLVMTR